MLAASAVDAMLKAKEYREGSLYARINQAATDHIITEDMARWAHHVRLGANEPRHADEEKPHATPQIEAAQSVEFASALGHILFVLPSRVTRGLKAAGVPEGERDGGACLSASLADTIVLRDCVTSRECRVETIVNSIPIVEKPTIP